MANEDVRRRRQKGRRGSHTYLGIPHFILRSDEFGRLDPWALKLLIELASNHNGSNNGDLSAAFSVLKGRGWRSPGTLSTAIRSLLAAGWIVTTRHGGRNRAALYAVTWWPVNSCEGKGLEIRPEQSASNLWRKTESVVGTCSYVVGTCSNDDSEEAA